MTPLHPGRAGRGARRLRHFLQALLGACDERLCKRFSSPLTHGGGGDKEGSAFSCSRLQKMKTDKLLCRSLNQEHLEWLGEQSPSST